MNRRQFLSLSALTIPLGGCMGGISGSGTDPETTSPEPATPDCWPSMCEGTQIVEVIVESGVTGSVVMKTDCREKTFSIQPGESVQIDRREDAEACGVTVLVDDEQVYTEDIGGYERRTVTIRSDGTVDEEGIVYSRGTM